MTLKDVIREFILMVIFRGNKLIDNIIHPSDPGLVLLTGPILALDSDGLDPAVKLAGEYLGMLRKHTTSQEKC